MATIVSAVYNIRIGTKYSKSVLAIVTKEEAMILTKRKLFFLRLWLASMVLGEDIEQMLKDFYEYGKYVGK